MYTVFHQVTLGVEIELLKGLSPIIAPPEPGLSATVGIACCFVEGAPKDGDSLLLIMKKVADDGVQVFVEDAVLGCACLNSSSW